MDYDLQKVDEIRKLMVIALFSASDEMMDNLALKGGNALNLIYGINARASIDIDVSMETSFEEIKSSIEEISISLEESFKSIFNEEGYQIFDFSLEPCPEQLREEEKDFWGGYQIVFKVLEYGRWKELKESDEKDIEDMRRQSIPLNERYHKQFKVDISKYEYFDILPADLLRLSTRIP